jgi:hypothetical protein
VPISDSCSAANGLLDFSRIFRRYQTNWRGLSLAGEPRQATGAVRDPVTGGLNQSFEQVERDGLDAVADS